MKTVGRNQKCPCGNGLRYKECHGNLRHPDYMKQNFVAFPNLLSVSEEKLRRQDLGVKIIESGANKGSRAIVVGRDIHFINSGRTFHEFLLDHLSDILEPVGTSGEPKKVFSDQHPISIWRQKLEESKNSLRAAPGVNVNLPLTGAIGALLYLAYDVFSLKSNADLQKKLIMRLHDKNLFVGARYEIQVAAMMVRAGFSLEFEDEDSRKSTHCEFTATHLHSGKKFSIEAKKSTGSRIRSNNHVSQALRKTANHQRIVFVDLNAPHSSSEIETPDFGKNAIRQLRSFEDKDPDALKLDPGYIFFTNFSCEHHLDSEDWKFLVLTEGFKIDDFRMDHVFPSLRVEIDAHERNREMHDLRRSMFADTEPPLTWATQCRSLAFGNAKSRPEIGENYLFKRADGVEMEGKLISASVTEHEKIVNCQMVDAAGVKHTIKRSFSDAELLAWRENPTGYFRKSFLPKTVRTMAERYEFYIEKFGFMSKSELLKIVRKQSDRVAFGNLDRSELLKFVCEQETKNDALELGPPPETDFKFYFKR